MAKNNSKITLHGGQIEVTGNSLKEGDSLPVVTLSKEDLKDLPLNEYAGKVVVISVIPSIDTPTCQLQTKRFNQEAAGVSKDVVLLTVSRDLPFALKRWCGAEGVDQVTCVSDYKYRTFGTAFGVEIPNIGILARAVFVVGKDSKIKLAQYVDEVSNEPEYEEVLKLVRELSA